MANPLVLMLMLGGRMGGRGLIKKVLLYTMMGLPGMLLAGGFSVKDILLVPAIAPAFAGMLGVTT